MRRVASERAAAGRPELDDRCRAPAPPSIAPSTPDHLRLAIRLICRRPELRPLCAGAGFAVDPAIDLPFRVIPGERTITLHPGALAEPIGAALVIRHALELALWQRLGAGEPGAGQRRTGALLACRVAARYAALLPARERAAGLQALPDWLQTAYRIAAEDIPEWHRLPAELERLDGGPATRSGAGDSQSQELLELAAPTEHLLVSGGGSRLRLDPASGLNVYGCGSVPRPEVLVFASSTASTISAPAYRAVEELRQALLRAGQAGRLEPTLAAEVEAVKSEILARCGAGDLAGTEVVLAPSGTDGELAALHLARRGERRLVNLVIAPEETGSGVMDAAGGRHFAPETPSGDPVAKGAALAGLAPERVTVETVEIRGPDGIARPLAAIDTDVAARVRRAVANGARCLVHLLDASKSGLAAPSPGVLRTLCARHGARIEVVVDACQLRLRPERIRSYLEHGWMVLVTGSKFAMGPPFAGALLVPARLARALPELPPLPAGFAQYFTRADWPAAWQPIGAVLAPRPNLGLLFRWRGALVEMAALGAIPEALRTRIVGELGAAIRAALAAAPLLEPLEPAQRDGLSTIFPFLLLRQDADGACRPLGTDAARQVWRWLRQDLADRLPAQASRAERRLAAMPCHVGQPITLGAAGALRLSLGARLIAEVGLDPALGASVELRLERQIGRARVVLDKAALIARYVDDLAAAEQGLSAAPPG